MKPDDAFVLLLLLVDDDDDDDVNAIKTLMTVKLKYRSNVVGLEEGSK